LLKKKLIKIKYDEIRNYYSSERSMCELFNIFTSNWVLFKNQGIKSKCDEFRALYVSRNYNIFFVNLLFKEVFIFFYYLLAKELSFLFVYYSPFDLKNDAFK